VTTLPSIAIIGAGAMGGAILSGLLAPEVTVEGGIRVTNRTEAKAALVRAEGVESFALETTPDANLRAVTGARVVLVGVKPAMVADTLAEIAPALEPGTTDSIVAVVTPAATLITSAPGSVLRAMPNTPAIVGRAVTGLAAGSRSSLDDLALGRRVFETVGTVVEVPESQIDALSTVSGSGPAYVFLLVEEFTAAAVGLGFSPEEASLLVRETFLGSMELLAASDRTPEELRRQVTSPNGTTERAIAVLQDAHLADLFARATAAALARARELAAG
jgi:pyrroline-5-carboxylate reductase